MLAHALARAATRQPELAVHGPLFGCAVLDVKSRGLPVTKLNTSAKISENFKKYVDGGHHGAVFSSKSVDSIVCIAFGSECKPERWISIENF
jgi:hypothetical protein